MKLFYSPFHDLVHKVLVVIHEAGLGDDVELVPTFPFRNLDREWVTGQYDTSALNPLAKVPFLTLDNGEALYPSQVVAEYLDGLGNNPLYPAAGPERFDALRRLALGDAIFDFAVQLSMEGWRDAEDRRPDLYTWLWPKIERSLDVCESEAPAWPGFDIGHVGLLQGVSYLDAWAVGRDDIPGNIAADWKNNWPALAAWFDTVVTRPSVRSHYKQDYEGDVSPENFARAVAEVLEVRSHD